MLARGEHVETDLLGLQGEGDHALDPLVLGGRPPGGGIRGDVPDAEDSELHPGSWFRWVRRPVPPAYGNRLIVAYATIYGGLTTPAPRCSITTSFYNAVVM